MFALVTTDHVPASCFQTLLKYLPEGCCTLQIWNRVSLAVAVVRSATRETLAPGGPRFLPDDRETLGLRGVRLPDAEIGRAWPDIRYNTPHRAL